MSTINMRWICTHYKAEKWNMYAYMNACPDYRLIDYECKLRAC